MQAVVLSGGSGSRLWPISRSKYPKQFAPLGESHLQDLTLKRLETLGAPIVVSSQQIKVLNELSLKKFSYPSEAVSLYEPQRRNTAAAIAWMARYMELKGRSSEVVGVFPADQFVANTEAFLSAVLSAKTQAEKGFMVTLGISPTFAATGYGYMELESSDPTGLVSCLGFREKPDLETATQYLESGKYLWNAGIFICRVDRLIDLFKLHAPEVWQPFAVSDLDEHQLVSLYDSLPSVSFDYAIMEKLSSEELFCVPADCGWDDVGSFDALANYKEFAHPGVYSASADGNCVFGDREKAYAVVGVDDLIVVDTQDALLVTQKGQSQDIKNIYSKLQKEQPDVADEHVFDDRPWGRYEVLRDDAQFKSKVIEVLPHQQLSYQSHAQREEHWIVVSGRGEVVLNAEVIPVKKGSYIHIPFEAKHRIRNTDSSEKLRFVEIQLGDYFGEDDIIRYEDDYGR